jgi:hypothetical protein
MLSSIHSAVSSLNRLSLPISRRTSRRKQAQHTQFGFSRFCRVSDAMLVGPPDESNNGWVIGEP